MKTLYVDGYTIGHNPSRTGGGFVISNPEIQSILVEKYAQFNFTNNEAEVRGLARAIEMVDEGGIVYTDSYVACCWVRKGKAKARPDLNELCKSANELQKIKNVKIKQIPRERNLAGIYIENQQLEGKKFY